MQPWQIRLRVTCRPSEFPQKEASFLFFSCILSWDREVQYMAFRELYCVNPLFLRLLLSELEKTQYLTINVSQHIRLFCFGVFSLRFGSICGLFWGETHLVLKIISATANTSISAPAHLAGNSPGGGCCPVNASAQYDLSVPAFGFCFFRGSHKQVLIVSSWFCPWQRNCFPSGEGGSALWSPFMLCFDQSCAAVCYSSQEAVKFSVCKCVKQFPKAWQKLKLCTYLDRSWTLYAPLTDFATIF